jgi:transcriptional regulator with XRE-family HTH domain
MSSNNTNIFNIFFETYGEALDKYLKNKGLTKTWLAKKIKKDRQKINTAQSMISRWTKGRAISTEYQNKINNILNIEIAQNNQGKWNISHTNKEVGNTEVNGQSKNLDQAIVDLVHLIRSGNIEKPSRDQSLQLVEFAEQLLGVVKESLKKQRSDQP